MNKDYELMKSAPFSLFEISKVLFIISCFMISFDIFLVFSAGFNFRASQILLFLPIAYAISKIWIQGSFIKPVGFGFLIIWCLFILFFIPNTDFLPRSIGYAFWLMFNIILILTCVQLFRTVEDVKQLVKWYIYSFFFVALFGISQFVLSVLGIAAPLVKDWWLSGAFPRVNGFSYEPSYFATYMLIGWILVAYLQKHKVEIVKPNYLKVIFICITAVMLLSSSRMGWIMMAIWYAQYPALFSYKLFFGKINKRYMKSSLWLLVLIVAASIFVTAYIGFENIIFLFQGIGLFGTASHSSSQRINEMVDTFTIFLESPIIGYSLGGISSAIANLRGDSIISLTDAKLNEGMSIFVEVLAASGIIGFIFFGIYFVLLLLSPIKLYRTIEDKLYRHLLLGLLLALLFEIMILQFNQNILRPYFWLHIAILSSVYNVTKTMNRGNSNV